MNALPFHPAPIASFHLGNIGLDDFICIGLIALAVVVVTFVVRGGEKVEEDKSPAASPETPTEE